MKQRSVFIAIILVVIVASAGIALWHFLPTANSPSGPVTVVDDLGRSVTITNYPPKRIVSLAPSTTEILFALGLGNKVVGVDSYSDYPVQAKNITQVGSFVSINIEKVSSLNPDLVVGTGISQSAIVNKLEGVGLPVVALLPQNVSGILKDITLVGKITGTDSAAKTLVDQMSAKIQDITSKTQNSQKPRVYLEYYFDGGYYTWGGQGLVNELVSKAGGTNVFAGSAIEYVTTSSEEVIKANPDIIIVTNGAMAQSAGLTPEIVKTRTGWNAISAVKNNKIYQVDESPLTRSGPRIVDALQHLAEILHPELYS